MLKQRLTKAVAKASGLAREYLAATPACKTVCSSSSSLVMVSIILVSNQSL